MLKRLQLRCVVRTIASISGKNCDEERFRCASLRGFPAICTKIFEVHENLSGVVHKHPSWVEEDRYLAIQEIIV